MTNARQLLDIVLDPGSFRTWDEPLAPPPEAAADSEYAASLQRAAERSGSDEAVLTGEATLRGRRVAVIAGEFGFLGGSIGQRGTDRLVAAVQRATGEHLPLLASPASAGTRMQEGTPAFVGMVRVAAALTRHRSRGLSYLVYLRNPTMGGVLASWGSLGQVTVAEPGALIGFLGPRVYAALHGRPFPAGVQVAEHLLEAGLVDAVVAPPALRELAAQALDVLSAPRRPVLPPPALEPDEPADVPAWESVQRSRRPERPGVRQLLRVAASSVTRLSGTGAGESEPGLLLALARFGSAPAVVVGQDRASQQGPEPFGPAGLREARRGIRLAAELRLPLVTVVDTPGATLSAHAEEGGLAGEIARTLADLITLPAPTLCLLLGQGTGGIALALLPADVILAAQHAWLSPLPPEGAAEILYRDTARAPEMAARQRVRSRDLRQSGIVDRIIAERPDAADEAAAFLARVGQVLEHHLVALMGQPAASRLAAREQRLSRLGMMAQ